MLPLCGAAAEDAAALMAKHAAYAGWHGGDGVVKTLRATGEVTREGKPRGKMLSLRYGVAFRDTYESEDGVRSDDGFTGNVSWTSNINGFTVRPVGNVVKAQYDMDALFGEYTATPAFTPKFVKTEKVDGVDCAVVRLTSQVGFPLDVYIDPASGAYRRVVVDPDGAYEVSVDGLAYTVVDAKRFLSAWHFGKSKIRYVYTSITPNAPIAPDELRPPKQTATWTFGDAPAQIEYVEYHGPRMYVDLSFNGVKGKFILDTGAGGTAVVDSFARRAGATRIGASTISGFGGSVKANLFHVDAIAVGGSTLHDVIVSSGLDEQDFAREGVVGLIGFDMLAATIAELNLDTKTLRLMDPAKVEPARNAGMVVHVDLSDRHIRAPMRIDDRHDVMATFDSGSPSDILFSRDLVKHDHVAFKSTGTSYIAGVGGVETVECGKIPPVALGPVRYEAHWACALESFARSEILLGLDFMRAFNFVFDYPDGLIVMIPRKHY
ncbi:MAG TPA: aspartyl protease family protein [Xanthomonadales bacterium]|nr:aspartyl protease family protein [Xanthomonadales bacterium]